MFAAPKRLTILYAEDDEGDRFLMREALAAVDFPADLRFVKDGLELLDYLKRRGPYGSEGHAPRPGLVLLDLNMPRMDGREALTQIRRDPGLRRLPVVVLTTSQAREDVLMTYDLGINGFITKPDSFERLVDAVGLLGRYWLELVELPG